VGIKARKIPIGLQKCLLYDIFGFLPSYQAGCIGRKGSLVSLDQRSKGFSVRKRLLNQLLVRRPLSLAVNNGISVDFSSCPY